ncbi:2-oxo-4-hydroxy-4-carboxy-5-ureidoimidazoline decarboxylase [Gordonia sp. ABSL11-1]|uniref:2-oxo-4-hydroxy-4-carboxy-5-ureidoimidazoline decarboxylase n=1 Tax=Gordonia sp. ABSL11-1 TaxID=3053924 RepID=UPI002572D27B|nr:2-oxo-4-hydroxy-4-carboxy-5-ureidoimidazoline decarboxylase [Gordonia sp. ABSL11-1]MDL9945965.1 2-oxo-4-hydroxy-4-carboxy-5-ureidoimidazoline decarboxylase [Gordonia sp. ABSL11-1]
MADKHIAEGGAPAPARRKRVHPVDEVPPAGKLVALGAQHVVAFYAGAVLVPLLIARAIDLDSEALTMLITADLFTCGIASLLQAVGVWKIGVRLPLLQGITFATLAPVIQIANNHGGGRVGLQTVYGAVIAAGVFTFLIAPFFAKLIRFLPPVVTGTLITIIGVCLIPVGAGDAVSDPATHMHDSANWRWVLYVLGTILLIVLMQRFFRGFMATIAVLLGLVVGTFVAWLFGDASFSSVGEASWLGFTPPFAFGWPRFDIVAIVSLIVVLLVVAVESTGSVFATGEIVGKRIKKEDVAATVRADGLATVIGGSFNSFPYTAFSENVGLVRLTGVKSRWVVACAGVIMIILGVLPKLAKVVESIPAPVLGGAALIMFATVAIVGIQTLTSVDFTDHRNLIIAATSLAVALYVQFSQSSAPTTVIEKSGEQVDVPALPGVDQAMPNLILQIPFSTGITMGAITAILLNLLFFHIGAKGPAVAGGGDITLDEVNTMTKEQFRETFGGVVQNVDWVLDRAWDQKPFEDVHDLRSAFQEAMLTGSDTEQLDLIRAFPDLGAEDEDTGELVAVDHKGLSHLEETEHENVVNLASAYRDHFGFPLVICARETERYDRVLRSGWARMDNSETSEKSFALIEIAKIANYRFDDLVADANPFTSARFSRQPELS